MRERRRRRNGERLRRGFALLLCAASLGAMRAQERPLTPGDIDSLLGSRGELSRREVAELVSNILTDAEEEIERTALEAVRAAVAREAGEAAYQKSRADSLDARNSRLEAERSGWRLCALAEAALIGAGLLLFGLTR